jgi:hypothetical protein
MLISLNPLLGRKGGLCLRALHPDALSLFARWYEFNSCLLSVFSTLSSTLSSLNQVLVLTFDPALRGYLKPSARPAAAPTFRSTAPIAVAVAARSDCGISAGPSPRR